LGKRRDKEATCSAILDVAEELFARRGYAETSMSAIARRCRVAKSLIHHHFGSKAALWRQVRARAQAEYVTVASTILESEADVFEILADLVRAYFRFLQHHPRVVQIIARTQLERDRDCSWVDDELSRQMIARVEEHQRRGTLRGDLTPVCLLSLCFSATVHYFQSRREYERFLADDELPNRDGLYLDNMIKIIAFSAIKRCSSPSGLSHK